MTLIDYVCYSCVAIFILYVITVNTYGTGKKRDTSVRPTLDNFTFLKPQKKSLLDSKKQIDNIK
jgi:hypothetical protein